jgi:hypothetical protein
VLDCPLLAKLSRHDISPQPAISSPSSYQPALHSP